MNSPFWITVICAVVSRSLKHSSRTRFFLDFFRVDYWFLYATNISITRPVIHELLSKNVRNSKILQFHWHVFICTRMCMGNQSFSPVYGLTSFIGFISRTSFFRFPFPAYYTFLSRQNSTWDKDNRFQLFQHHGRILECQINVPAVVNPLTPPPQPPSPLVSLLSQNTISFKCFKTQWFWFCNIWQLLPRFSIPNDTFSNYSLHSLNFIYFGYVSKTLFKIPHLLDFQKFPNPPNYWDSRLFDT